MESPIQTGGSSLKSGINVLFFSSLLGAKLVSHILHLQIEGESSYAKHIALDTFYNGVSELADTIIEMYQGYTQSIVDYDTEDLLEGLDKSPIEYLKSLRSIICDNRYEVLPEEVTNFHSEVDNVLTLIDQTVYKLTFLK